jgi:hypothetical protein
MDINTGHKSVPTSNMQKFSQRMKLQPAKFSPRMKLQLSITADLIEN